jgi:hypothetical protein
LLHRLWLAPSVINADPSRLSALIIGVTSAAMTEAAQDSHNKVALLLGAEMTELVEQLSGVPAPARAEDDDPGMTVEEFQRRRAERLGERTVTAAPVADVPVDVSAEVPADVSADDDWTTFDPAPCARTAEEITAPGEPERLAAGAGPGRLRQKSGHENEDRLRPAPPGRRLRASGGRRERDRTDRTRHRVPRGGRGARRSSRGRLHGARRTGRR